jgi:hypothetical protein
MTDQPQSVGAFDSDTASDQAKLARVADVATTEAADVASTAAEGARDLVDEASAQARAVASQTKQQLDRLVMQSRDELRLQAEQRGSQAAGQLRTLSQQLTALAEGRPEGAGPLVGYLEDVQSQIRRLTSRLEHGGTQGLVDDVSSFARRRPGVFLAAAVGAGFVAGRVLRATAANERKDGEFDSPAASASPPVLTEPVPAHPTNVGTLT